jgi:DNA-binding winged helix-turn-helix (wHTH) protein
LLELLVRGWFLDGRPVGCCILTSYPPLPMRLPARLQFGDCVFDRDARALTRHAAPVHLTPKAYRLLELLLESRPRVVSKTEIHRRLWPNCHVSPTTLTALVAELRHAIDDEPRGQNIRTVYGHGYVFAGAVTFMTHDVDPGVVRLVWAGGYAELGVGEHVIGRGSDCAVRLRDRRISRHHARVTLGPAGLTIEDCQSHNGTSLNGTPLHGRALLHDLDVLSIGGVRVSVDLAWASVASTIDD